MKIAASVLCALLTVHIGMALGQNPDEALAAEVKRHEVAAPAALLDRQAFITKPALRSVLLSPDGSHVAYLTDEGHDTVAYLYELVSGRKLRLFNSTALATIHWTSDSSHLILNLGNAIGVLAVDRPDRPAYIAMLDAARNEKFLGVSQPVITRVFITGQHADGNYMLEQVDFTGARRELVRQDSMIVSALASGDDGAVIVESATSQGHRFMALAEDKEDILFTCALLETCHQLALQDTTNTLWLEANVGANLIGLTSYSLDERSLVLRHSHAEGIVDLSAVVLAQHQPLVVQYHEGLLRNHGLDETTEANLQTLQALLPDSALTPQISNDGRTWLVTESSSVLQHPRYYLFDTQTESLHEILKEERDSAGAISAAILSARIPLQYPAQDGSVLHGYVSLPNGRPLAATAMITLVHGGPIGRVDSSYSEFTQFLVNRGYSVFEPNFRASTGYGRKYVEQSAGEFGDGLVQQDIIDGVYYLTEHGIGDPDQLGIAGHSFGGSAVLAGLAFTPELFKAGFASAPAADMATVMQFQLTPERSADIDPAMLALSDLMFGAVDDASAMQAMSARSPQARLAQINAPLLLIAGGDDRQVPISHVKDYALELLNQQKIFSLFIDENEGHGIGFTSTRSKLAYFWMAEEFFAAYLGGSKQALDDPALASYIRQNLLINTNPEFSVQVAD